MFGLFKEMAEGIGEVVGTVAGVAIAPIAIVLNCSEAAVRRAVKAGCRTQKEIAEFLDLD